MDPQKLKRKELKHKTKENHGNTKGKTGKNKGSIENCKINWKTKFKMAINTYLSTL